MDWIKLAWDRKNPRDVVERVIKLLLYLKVV
jgi:hypothetical protein